MWTTSWTGKSTQCCGRLPPASYVIFCFCCYHPLPYVMIPQPCGPPGLREYAQSHWVSESYRCVLKAVSEPLSTGNLCWAWLFSLAVAFLVVTLTPHLPSDRVMPGSSGKAHNPWEPAARLLSCSQTVRVGESRNIELPRDGQFFSVFFEVGDRESPELLVPLLHLELRMPAQFRLLWHLRQYLKNARSVIGTQLGLSVGNWNPNNFF